MRYRRGERDSRESQKEAEKGLKRMKDNARSDHDSRLASKNRYRIMESRWKQA